MRPAKRQRKKPGRSTKRSSQPVKRPTKREKKRPSQKIKVGAGKTVKPGSIILPPKGEVGRAKKSATVSVKLNASDRAKLREASKLITSKSVEQIQLGVGMLVNLPGGDSLRKLKNLSRSTVDFKRAAGIWGLGAKRDLHASNTILKALKDESIEVRRAACEAAVKLFPEQHDPIFRMEVIDLLRKMRMVEAKQALVSLRQKFPLFFLAFEAGEKLERRKKKR